jgi:DNA-binding transcriptional regulator YdaS (Cro superfamily)
MLERGTLVVGDQVRLATHFGLSRQRVNQLVMLERELMKNELAEAEERVADHIA